MRVLMTTQPGLGHLHPLVPIAQALRDAGDEVAFACAASFAPRVERLGFRCFAAGMDWLESDAGETFPELKASLEQNQPLWLLTEVFADIAAHEMATDLFDVCDEWRPDIIVRNDYEFAACVVAEKLDIPHATVGMEFSLSRHEWDALIGEQLAYLRSAYGLKPYPAVDMLYRYLYLSPTPPSYTFPASAPVPEIHHLRPVNFDRSGEEVLPAWIANLPDRPTVHATMGTVFNRTEDIYETIIAGLRDEPINLIITIGRNRDPDTFGPQPDNVYIEQYIPHTLLLPHCDLVITHGGFNTTMSVLSHGLPLILIPISASQPLHANLCAKLELGRVIVREPGQFETYLGSEATPAVLSPSTIREMTWDVLETPAYKQNVETLRDEIRALPEPDTAVPLLHQVADTNTPLVTSSA